MIHPVCPVVPPGSHQNWVNVDYTITLKNTHTQCVCGCALRKSYTTGKIRMKLCANQERVWFATVQLQT